MYCFDTDVLSAAIWRDPPIGLIRRLGATPLPDQFTTAITIGEVLYGLERAQDAERAARVSEMLRYGPRVLPFDEAAAPIYASIRARLEREGRRLAEPDLRIAAICLSRDLTLVTGNVRHFSRIPDLRVENWLR